MHVEGHVWLDAVQQDAGILACAQFGEDRTSPRIGEPEPQKVAPPGFFRPILVSTPRMKCHEIVEELNVADGERDIGSALRSRLALHADRLFLGGGMLRNARQALGLFEGVAGTKGTEVALVECEHRMLVVRQVPRVVLAEPGPVEVLCQ